jgi:hypothetical protein
MRQGALVVGQEGDTLLAGLKKNPAHASWIRAAWAAAMKTQHLTVMMLSLLASAGFAQTPARNLEFVERRYKAHAQVLLLSLPILSLKEVGGGTASVETRDATVTLRFAAGSSPKRAKGLNRLGLIEETVTESGGTAAEAVYFGFMTSSKEQSLDQAKISIATGTGATHPYTAIRGTTSLGKLQGSRVEVDLPASFTWQELPGVTGLIRTSMDSQAKAVPALIPSGHTPATFLYSLHKAIASPNAKQVMSFLYNGKAYRLHVEKHPDRGMGRKLVQQRIAHNADSVWKLSGEVEHTVTQKRTPFAIWYEPNRNSGLPLRIEYRARAFLRLIFEYEPPPPSPASAEGDRLLTRRSEPQP